MKDFKYAKLRYYFMRQLEDGKEEPTGMNYNYIGIFKSSLFKDEEDIERRIKIFIEKSVFNEGIKDSINSLINDKWFLSDLFTCIYIKDSHFNMNYLYKRRKQIKPFASETDFDKYYIKFYPQKVEFRGIKKYERYWDIKIQLTLKSKKNNSHLTLWYRKDSDSEYKEVNELLYDIKDYPEYDNEIIANMKFKLDFEGRRNEI